MGLADLAIVRTEETIPGGAIDICSKDEDEEYEPMNGVEGLSIAKR